MASGADSGLFVEGTRMPNLPPSVAAVLARPGVRGNGVSHRHLLEESLSAGEVVEGAARLDLEILPR